MAQLRHRTERLQRGNIYAFSGAVPAPDEATAALELVFPAAEVFPGLQDRARDTEARAQALCREASEKVRAAEMRADASDRAHRELVAAVDKRLQDASKALEQAQASIADQVDRRTAAELRAQQAEAETRDAKRSLV